MPTPILHFADNFEAEQQRLWTLEYVQQMGMKVGLSLVDHAKSVVDPLYREAARGKVYAAEVEVMAVGLRLAPGKYQLKKYGIEEERDVLMSFATAELDQLGLLREDTHFLVGGRIRMDGDDFVIESQHRSETGYFTNSGISLYLVCSALRPRIRPPGG